jgi:hypothetical protein
VALAAVGQIGRIDICCTEEYFRIREEKKAPSGPTEDTDIHNFIQETTLKIRAFTLGPAGQKSPSLLR